MLSLFESAAPQLLGWDALLCRGPNLGLRLISRMLFYIKTLLRAALMNYPPTFGFH